MKVLQVIPDYSKESSGPSYYMANMASTLAAQGVDLEVYSVGDQSRTDVKYADYIFPRVSFPCRAVGRSPALRRALFDAAQRADIVHNNSLWMFPNIYPYRAVQATRRIRTENCPKLVTSPHGTLALWALRHSAWKKRIMGWLGQYAALSATDMWHATCYKEYEEIRAQGYRQPVAIIPIGMNLPDETVLRAAGKKVWGTSGRKKVVFLGRLHQVKGVDNLLLAWGKIAPYHLTWELVFAGPDGGMMDILKKIIVEQKIDRVHFAGEINGDKKYAFLSSVDLYVLPSHTENFGVTVAEALACGTPVIASRHTPWGGVVENRCGWCVSNDVGTLAATLDEAMSLPQETLKGMGVRGREWIRRDFSWRGVGQRMKQSYEWLLGQGERPKWIPKD